MLLCKYKTIKSTTTTFYIVDTYIMKQDICNYVKW